MEFHLLTGVHSWSSHAFISLLSLEHLLELTSSIVANTWDIVVGMATIVFNDGGESDVWEHVGLVEQW